MVAPCSASAWLVLLFRCTAMLIMMMMTKRICAMMVSPSSDAPDMDMIDDMEPIPENPWSSCDRLSLCHYYNSTESNVCSELLSQPTPVHSFAVQYTTERLGSFIVDVNTTWTKTDVVRRYFLLAAVGMDSEKKGLKELYITKMTLNNSNAKIRFWK